MSVFFFVFSFQLLKRPEYFSKFGKIHKIVVNNSTNYAGPQVSSEFKQTLKPSIMVNTINKPTMQVFTGRGNHQASDTVTGMKL